MSIIEDVQKLEIKIDHKLNIAVSSAIAIVDKVVPAIQKMVTQADNTFSDIVAATSDPVFALIASDIPGGIVVEAAVVKILNRYLPYVNAAAKDPAILSIVSKGLIAEISSVIKGGENDINDILNFVIKFLKFLGVK